MFLIDNTVLSNFALIGELKLLQDYSKGKGAITNYVLAEFAICILEKTFNNRINSGFIRGKNNLYSSVAN